jgi:hypothetical protein
MTPKQQIDRLLKPGYTYRNLNPFEVLQVDPDLSIDDIKKKFRVSSGTYRSQGIPPPSPYIKGNHI